MQRIDVTTGHVHVKQIVSLPPQSMCHLHFNVARKEQTIKMLMNGFRC